MTSVQFHNTTCGHVIIFGWQVVMSHHLRYKLVSGNLVLWIVNLPLVFGTFIGVTSYLVIQNILNRRYVYRWLFFNIAQH